MFTRESPRVRRFRPGWFSRRGLLGSGLGMLGAGLLPGRLRAGGKSVRIGLLGPLSGPVAAWGKPGLDGSLLRAEWINAAGGVRIGSESLPIEIVAFDDEYDPALARIGARRLIRDEGVSFIMMLGGDSWPGAEPVVQESGMLCSTLLPSDLGPTTTTLIAPAEVHPVYNVTGVDWLARNRPHLKTAAICAQDDVFGLPSVATYLAAFEAAGIRMTDEPLFFDPATADFAPLVRRMLSGGPQIVCLDTCYPDYILPICEQLFQQGFAGQILSCTLDFYDRIIARTSEAFMEGTIFQFRDFDDPALNRPEITFDRPNEFYAEYQRRHPGQWSSVSWQYAATMDLWKSAAEQAGTTAPAGVLAAMKESGRHAHVFGAAEWWGDEVFGISNALVGNWPVVEVQKGKARIQEFVSVTGWYDRHGDILKRHLAARGN